ncbi:MAG: ABC transporter permease subunit [Romboutsia sp.]
MKDLLIYELKKITKKRLNIIVTLGSLVLTFIFFSSNVFQHRSMDKDGNQVSGFSAIKLDKKFQGELEGLLTEDRIKYDILQCQSLFENPDNIIVDGENKRLNDEAYNKYVGPYASYLRLISNNYTDPEYYDYYFSELDKISTENGVNFYKARDEKVSKFLNSNYEGGNYSNKEKSFWLNKNEKIEAPYMYGYHEGWNVLLNCMELLAVPIIAICICIAPVFAGEYQSGADSIILSSRYGKSKLVVAKLLASFIFAVAIYTIHIALGTGIILSSFGVEGWNLPLQILYTIIPYSLNFLTGTIVCIVTLYLILFGMVSITLLMSSKMKSAFPVLIVIILIMIVPMFFGTGMTNGLWNHIFRLLPYWAGQPVFGAGPTIYYSYEILGATTDILSMRMIVYALLGICCIPFAYRGFKKHQVS